MLSWFQCILQTEEGMHNTFSFFLASVKWLFSSASTHPRARVNPLSLQETALAFLSLKMLCVRQDSLRLNLRKHSHMTEGYWIWGVTTSLARCFAQACPSSHPSNRCKREKKCLSTSSNPHDAVEVFLHCNLGLASLARPYVCLEETLTGRNGTNVRICIPSELNSSCKDINPA